MERAQMTQRFAFASDALIEVGEVAMRLDRERIAFDHAQEALQRVLELLAFAINQAQAQMDFRICRRQHGRAHQMAGRTGDIAFALEQRSHPHMHFEIARLVSQQVAIEHQRAQRIRFGQPLGLCEAFTHASRAEALLDLAGQMRPAE